MIRRLYGAVLLILAAGVLVAPPAFAVMWGAQHRPEHEDVRAEMDRASSTVKYIAYLARALQK